MATRLNEGHREVLRALAENVVDCPKESAAEDKAYQAAAPLVTALVHKTYPVADMKVLSKYNTASHDKCIKVRLADGDTKKFNFRSDEEAPLVVLKTYSGQIYIADPKASRAIELWNDAHETLEKARKDIIGIYRAFIANAKTYEDVLAVWPEAIAASNKIKLNLPVALSEADIERIAKDSARRMKASASKAA